MVLAKVVGLSGRYDLTRAFAWYRDLFSEHDDPSIYFKPPKHFVPNISDESLLGALRSLDIRLVVGDADLLGEQSLSERDALAKEGLAYFLIMARSSRVRIRATGAK